MTFQSQVDGMYAAFCHTLPAALRDFGRTLPHRLELAPIPDATWSQVFGNEVTLAAPLLVAEGMPHVHPAVVRDAALAHLLAIIDAFGTDRIEDEQVAPTSDLCEVLRRIRRSRDQALARVCAIDTDPSIDFGRADNETARAIRLERGIMKFGDAVDFARYEVISLGKQAVGVPACMALARAADWDDGRRTALRRTLEAVWLALQFQDDVIDWEDDMKRSGAWAVVLAQAARTGFPARERPTERNPIRRMVHASGVLARMLGESHRNYRAARMRASVLGLHQLASWASDKETRAAHLAKMEREHAGYAVRMHALAPWAAEILA
jgi:hypothetical protein